MPSVKLGGNVISAGFSSVIAREVVWSTNPNPTVSDMDGNIYGNGDDISYKYPHGAFY